MANILLLNTPFVFSGLGALNYTVPATGLYSIVVQLSENPPSGLSVTITKNASLIFTSPVITPTQIAQQFKVGLSLTAADAIVVTLASSQPIDSLLNTVKSTIYINQGL